MRRARRGPGRNRSGGNGSRYLLALPTVLSLGTLGCAGETAPSLGADTIPVPVTSAPTTIPAETTTTIDFNRPVTQQLTLLPDDATIDEFTDIVNDMRGPSTQVAFQMDRLAEFQELPSPAGAQILDFSTSVAALEDAEYSISSMIAFRAPQDTAVLATFIEEELKGLGWNKASESVQALSDGDQITLVYRQPGVPGELTELTVTVGNGPGATLISYDYRNRLGTEGEAALLRFQAWQSEVRVPRSAEVIESSIRTADEIGTMSVVQTLTAETAAEARQDVLDLVPEDEFTVVTSQESGTTAAPLLLEDEFGNQLMLEFSLGDGVDVVDMTVIHTFDLDPVD